MSSKRGKKPNELKAKLEEYLRILTLAKKPGKEEYMQVAKISAIGILLIGTIGFLIYLGMGVLPQTITGMGKGELSATFIEEVNTSKATQELVLRLNNTDQESSTGKIHIQLTPILCSVDKTTINVSEIAPGSSKEVKIQVTDIQENADIEAVIWGENVVDNTRRTPLRIAASEQEQTPRA